MNEFENQFKGKTKSVSTSFGCLVYPSGKVFADSSRYNDIMKDHQDLQFNLNDVQKDNGLVDIMNKHAAAFPNPVIENSKKSWNIMFWVGRPLQLTEECSKTSSPSDVLDKFKTITNQIQSVANVNVDTTPYIFRLVLVFIGLIAYAFLIMLDKLMPYRIAMVIPVILILTTVFV